MMAKTVEKKIILAVSCVLIATAVLLFLPPVQNGLLLLGGKIVGRTLNYPAVWVSRMIRVGLLFCVMAVSLVSANFIDWQKVLHSYEKNKKIYDFIFLTLTFIFLAFCYIFRCTESSLWFDEGIEYWVSKSISGTAYGSFIEKLPNMYERICATIQPPLYNFLMFLWLKICDTEFWFKLFGAVCFVAGNIAFYLTCKEFTNKIISCVITLVFGTSRVFIGYSHEAAEYSCLFCFICWMTLYFVKSLKSFSWKNLSLYFVFATLSIYSQYGACFVILGTAIVLFAKCLNKNDSESCTEKITRFSVLGASTITIFITPLYFLFVKRQLIATISSNNHTPVFEYGNVFVDYLKSFMDASSYFYSSKLIIFALVLIFCLMIYDIVQKKLKNSVFAGVCVSAFIAWTVYYFAVRYNIYKVSYTSGFGNRWGMSFCSIFGILIACSFISFYKTFAYKTVRKISGVIFTVVLVLLLGENTVNVIKRHDIKCHVREAYQYLNENEARPVIVEAWYQPTLSFYILHDKNSNLNMDFVFNLPSRSEDESEEVLREQFESILSRSGFYDFYYFCGDEPTNQDAVLKILSDMGYILQKSVQFDERKLGDPTVLEFTLNL